MRHIEQFHLSPGLLEFDCSLSLFFGPSEKSQGSVSSENVEEKLLQRSSSTLP